MLKFKDTKEEKNENVEYLLKWEDCGEDFCMWEPSENLHCQDLIKSFKSQCKKTITRKGAGVGKGKVGVAGRSQSKQKIKMTIIIGIIKIIH